MFNLKDFFMADINDIVVFTYNGEQLYGVVIKHYDHPLNDFYIIYSDYTLFEWVGNNDYIPLIDNVFIPAFDAAIAEYKLKKQRIKDISKMNEIVNDLLDMKNMDIESLFK